MKVAINSCYGGFNLSDDVVKLCIEKGMTYSENHDDNVDFTFYKSGISDQHYHPRHNKDNKYYRTHPIIIEAIEELGEKKSSGFCSKIHIVDIPFEGNNGWDIAEYDGKEWIEESHQTWG